MFASCVRGQERPRGEVVLGKGAHSHVGPVGSRGLLGLWGLSGLWGLWGLADEHDAVGGGCAAVHASLEVVGLDREEGHALRPGRAEHGPDTLEILCHAGFATDFNMLIECIGIKHRLWVCLDGRGSVRVRVRNVLMTTVLRTVLMMVRWANMVRTVWSSIVGSSIVGGSIVGGSMSFLPQVRVLWSAEAGEGGCVGAQTLRDGVELLLEVGAQVLRDVVDQEVDVPREGVVCVEYAVDVSAADVVAHGHGELVDEGRRDGGGLDDGRPVLADLLLHGDGELNRHVEVAQESGEEGGGGDEGLVGHEGAWYQFRLVGLVRGCVGPVLHVLVVHPRVHLLVEGGVVQGEVDVKVSGDLARCLTRVVLLRVHFERGEGTDRQ